MSMYHFVRGPRLFIQAAREATDPDAVNQNPQDEMFEYGRNFGGAEGDIHRVQTQRVFNTESHGTASSTNRVARKGGLKSITRKIIRKTTTLTRGEQRTVTESMVTQTGKDGKEITTPQRFVSETVVRTPWGTTDEEEADDVVPHSSGSSGHKVRSSRTVKKDSYTSMTQVGGSNGHSGHHGWANLGPDARSRKISDIVVGMEENVSAKDVLLKWAQKSTAKYPGVRVDNFTSSWKDGLAFNAIIHRNRPDLIDWRAVQRRNVRERLESAFTVAERDCGVTRLLDAEDVDTPQPDEKSLITYISSLYDAFPEPPRLHPLYDTDSQKKWEEYRETATVLYTWIRQNLTVMQDRHFSSSLIEMRRMAAEMTRFRVEEVPPRNHDKQRLAHLFRDVEKHFRDGEIDRELHIENIEKNWQILLMAHQEKDQAIHDEIKKLEKLQRLAEKIHREAKQVEIRLDEIEQRIEEEAKRIDRLHPLDAKHNCDQLERDMQMAEDNIKSMFTDAQTLRDARYSQSNEIHKMVQHLHQRWISIRTLMHNRLLSVLASISFPIEEKSVTRMSKTVLETRLVETNSHFRFLQEVGDWIKGKQKQLQDADYGSDLPSVQAELEKQHKEHRGIEKFQSSVDKCSSAKSSFHGDELQLYINYLNGVQKSYTELLMSSKKRTADLETLMDFVQSATNELIWLSEKEEREITRDWSSKSLNLVEVEQYYEALMSELVKREIQFNAVQDRGESLVLQHHPASKCIETYMSAMQTQWAWLLQLTICLETHLKHVATYQQYFSDIKECEQTIARKEEMLNTVFSKSDFSLDEGELLLKEMQELREDLTKYGEVIQSLSNQSREIIPLKQRKMNISHPLTVTAICNYKQNNQQMVINKDERCTLRDNSQRVRWRITNSSGLEGMVPSVCFLIPPPDKESLDAAERLRRMYDRVVTLWQKKQLKMRQNMIFATIKVVKSWDLAQFLAMGAEQRIAIRKALNEDADKLIQEGDPTDPALRRLRREIDEVNRLFDEFERKAMEAEKSKNTSKVFIDQVATLQNDLEDLERNLVSRVNAPIPRDVDSLERLVIEHKEYESRIQMYESRVETIQRTYASIPQKTASLQTKLDRVVEKWERIWSLSHLYVERLKCVEIVLSSLEETNTYVSQFEMKLSSYENLPIDDDGLKRVSDDLFNLQNTAQVHQHKVDRMIEDTKNVRRVTEKSRGTQKRHADVEKLEDEVHRTASRWTSACTQVVERLRTVEVTSEHASRYNTSYQTEMNWLDSVDNKAKSLPLVEGSGAKRKINPHMTLYNSVIEEKITIEQVNTMGARLAKEARNYDAMVDNFRESMQDVHPSLDASLVKKAKLQSAEEVIIQELDLLNLKYQLLVDNLYHRIQQLAVIAGQEDPNFDPASAKVPAPSPIKTYRMHMIPRDSTSPLGEFLEGYSEDQTDYVQQKSSATLTLSPGGGPTPKKRSVTSLKNGDSHTNGNDESDNVTTVPPSLRFTQIRSAKRVEKVEEGISTETATQIPLVIDPLTRESLTLAQAIGCGLIDIQSGQFVHPQTGERISLQEAAELGYLDAGILHKLMGTCGVVDPATGAELTLLEAIKKGYYDLSRGNYIHPQTGEPISAEQAIKLGLNVRQKLATEAQYKQCEQTVHNLTDWLSEIEKRLASQETLRETVEELRKQTIIVKQIRDEIDDRSQMVGTCLDQIRHLVATGGEILSSEEISTLEKNGKAMKNRYDRVSDQSEKLYRKLMTASDELKKYKAEVSTFKVWMDKSIRVLEDKERNINNLSTSGRDNTKEFVSDVIAHQGDLRFITMSAQKFVEESREYLQTLNEFRTNLPQRLPYLESRDSAVKEEVTQLTSVYQDLLSRANKLYDRLSQLGNKQKDFQDALNKALAWLKEVTPRAQKVLSEPVAGEPKLVEDQLNRAKSLQNDILSNGRLIDGVRQTANNLLNSMEELTPAERNAIEGAANDLQTKYQNLLDAIGEKIKDLDSALVQSQGLQDSVDSVSNWLSQAENQMRSIFKPASLIRERLDEQIREVKMLQADIDSHRPSLESMARSADDLMRSGSARVSKKVETKLKDVLARYEKLVEKLVQRAVFLQEVSTHLDSFLLSANSFDQWFADMFEVLETRLTGDDAVARLDEVMRRKESRKLEFDEMITNGRTLVAKKDVTDTMPVKDKIKALETQWKDLTAALDDKNKLSKSRADALNAYEKLRDQVQSWLTNMETRVNNLNPVSVELDIIKQQNDELRPIAKEHRDYNSTIDKVNELGTAYDAMTRGERIESPRRRGIASSPVKRPSFRASAEPRSPSPTKALSGFDGRSPMSPSGSSGFGSRRSSQEGFLNLEDASPVQQQLNEINQRYQLIGMKLSDRQSDLDSTRDEVKKIADNLKSLAQFLEKEERLMPKDTIPQSREEADKMLRTIKSILEDIYDKQGLLDNTRIQVSDLLRRKPTAIGADNLQNTFETINSKWKDLQDRCKQKVKFLENMKEFHDSYDNLNTWLNSKDKMLGVLGPIASDPRMVQSQMQQVHVIRDEFRQHKPILDGFNNAGDEILSQTNASTPDGRKIEDKLATVNQKWNDLLHKLDDREGNLEQASGASTDFYNSLNKLQDNLHKISDDLDDLIAEKGEPDEMLKKLESIERHLNNQRPILADVEAAGEHLCDILQDPTAKSDIKQKLGQVGRLYNQCQKKLDNCKAELENSRKDVLDFNEACDDAHGWLQSLLAQLMEKLLVSADRDTLRRQVAEFDPIYRDVMGKEHEIIMTINKGKDLVKTSRKNEQRLIQQNMEKIQKSWDRLKKETVDRQNKLQNCNEHCKKYDKSLEPFVKWLTQAEDKMETFRLTSFKKADIDKLIKDVNTFKNELWRRTGDYETTRSNGDTFVSACDKDKEGIKEELQDLKERWEALNAAILAKAQELEDAAARLNEFNDNCRDVKNALGRCEDKLASHDALGDASRDPKLLQRIKAIEEEAKKLAKPLDNVTRQGEDLCHSAQKQRCDDAPIREAVDDLLNRFDNLTGKLGDRLSELASSQRVMAEFQEQMKSLSAEIGELDNEFGNMKPIGRDIPTVKTQIREMEVFSGKLHDKKGDVEQVSARLEDLIRQGVAADAKGQRDQIENLRKQLTRIETKSKQREDDLDRTLAKLESFYDLYNATNDEINDLVQQERSMSRTIGGDVESIRAQQAEFKEFRARYVEAVGKQVDECNKGGQGLIQSAPNGVNTSGLEKDLEKLNDKWNALKERINDQERKLDAALLQSGKFKEALDGLDKWLSEMEELVANQKPPSADFKVVKAQLQEQKFLNKMLTDRQPSVTSLFKMAKEVAANADPSERANIEGQMQDMGERYSHLCDGAKDRQGVLEEAMKIAKNFQDRIGPLADWLEKQSKKLKDMSVIPTDEEKIARRIKEHDSFHDGLLRKQPEFNDLADIAQHLMELVGDEEAGMVADKLQEVTDRYGRLVEESEALGQLLKQSKAGLRHLVLSYEELVAWMDSVDKRLARFKVLSVHKEKLLEQMDQLANLVDEIKDREKQVDETVEAGLDLMKNISGDEAIQLKDKLDSLQRRHNDINTKAAEYLKNAQDALPLVTQFHDCHNNLTDWMGDAEDILKSLDNTNLASQEKEIVRLEAEIQDQRKVLEAINLIGPQLCQLSPGEGASTIEGLVTRDNRRFDAICEQVQRRAERIQMSKARSMEVLSDIDDLLEWFREVEGQLTDAEKPSCEPDVVRIQLQEHKALNDEISSQKGRVRDVLATAKKVLREAQQGEDTATLREKAEDLKETMENVSKLSSDRLSALEQALPLAEHFFDTHIDLNQWMDAMEDEMGVLDTPAIRPDQIMKLQDKTQQFIQSLNEHKPLLDKLNKTGGALVRLCNDDDSGKVQEIMHHDNERYNALRVHLRDKQQQLEKALQETSQFKDKLDGMLNALENTADQVNNAEPIAAHPDKIRDQIDENQSIIDDVKKREDAFNAVKKQAADVIDKAANKNDPAVRDIKQKLDRLNSLWDQIQKATKTRGKNLDEALVLAEKFWEQLQAVMEKLDALQETLKNQEPPAVEPKAIQKQQEALHEIKKDIEKTKPEVNHCRQSGQHLMKIVGDQDKPEIKKNIEDLDSAWDNITALFAKREENLIDAMEKAMEFHDTLQALLRFLDRAEERLTSFGGIGADIDAVKRQIKELKDFKNEVDPMMVKVEALNRQAQELTERTSPDQAAKIKGPLAQVNRRWDELLKGIVERQRELENALLRLGQFQHALQELMAWIEKTNKQLDTLKPVFGDPQIIEVELAKLKVTINDIQAHQNSVDTLNDAGRQIIESEKGSDNASKTQHKLNDLNNKWSGLQQKAYDRQKELEDALRDAQAFNAEIQDLLLWLSDVDAALNTSKPVGGLPETAQEQLNRFMEIFNELELNRPKVEAVLQQGQEYLKRSTEGAATNLTHNLRTLKQRWDSVMNRANDKKIKLEIALKEAMEFHKSVQDFTDWLTEAEQYLSGLEPVSRVLEKVVDQVESHKDFQKQVSAHRESMLNLEKKGNHLKYFSQKQDVILIKNLLISVQHRWDRVVSKSTERTRALDHGLKEAKEFHDSWASLCKWLDEAEKSLDEMQATAGNNPVKIKQMLAKHKEFQRTLAAKQPSYDSTMKLGKTLKDKAPKSDEPTLRQMLNDLKNKWNNVCNKSVERQRGLEDALLRSGQFKDALQELLDWLKMIDALIVEDGPVHGDLDTVTALVEQHKKIEEELENRRGQMTDIIQTAEEMMETASVEERNKLQASVREIKSSFEKVRGKCDTKSRRLEQALKEAEKLHKAVHMLLEWLSDAEMKLRFAGQLPEDEETTRRLLEEQDKFMKELALKEREKDETIELAKSILAKAHPDAVSVIKHWISIIQSRWDEISSWALQRQQKLQAHLATLRGIDELLEELMAWLQKCEDTLTELEAEPLPDDLGQIQVLIKEHKEFMEGMAKRQAEIDAVCKPKLISSRPSIQKGKAGSRLRSTTPGGDSRETSPELDLAQRRLSKAIEPQIKSPRVKALWDKWKHVWMMAWERQRRLQDKYNYLLELEKVKNFSWEDWRKRFLKFMNHKKSRVTDLFRKIDRNNNGLIPREEFIDAIMKTKFPTSRLEMNAVADMFDHGDHLIDYMEFIAALRPEWLEKKPMSEGDLIDDEVQKQVMKCTCRQKFRVFQVGEGKYRFGDSQKLRLVRILRSTVMVRVGGGWVALDEFLVKNDPCRAKGRTNIELREQFILADGVSQTMTAFKAKAGTTGGASTVSSQSGNRSAQSLPAAGPITKVKERSIRSVPMGGRARSTDRTTPDSTFSDDGFSLNRLPRKSSAGPGRASQPGSRAGSKPPSRAGSNVSLDSTDDAGSRIPVRRSASLKRGSSGAAFGSGSPRTPLATSTPVSSRVPFSLSTNVNGSGISRGPSTERAHSFTRPSSATPIKRTGSSSSIHSVSSLNNSGSRSRIPRFVGDTGSGEPSLDRSRTPSSSNIPGSISQSAPRSRTPSTSNIPVAVAQSTRTRTPSGSNVSFSLAGGTASAGNTTTTTTSAGGRITRTSTTDSATKSSSSFSRSSFQQD